VVLSSYAPTIGAEADRITSPLLRRTTPYSYAQSGYDNFTVQVFAYLFTDSFTHCTILGAFFGRYSFGVSHVCTSSS